MLDTAVANQLREVFASLSHTVELVYDSSSHQSQDVLLKMLEAVASTSKKIVVRPSGRESSEPSFRLYYKGHGTGVFFRGIPGGHEFSSLIVAILNVDGQGKLPDAGLAFRIRKLKGPIRIQTYISQTCENCPDVVQALNQMALIHPDFHHKMVDGGCVQEEVEKLGIQGVPSVMVDSKMLHSGRIHFLDLLQKLEDFYGTEQREAHVGEKYLGHFDVVVLGGGPAGVSAAIYSARKGLKTALLAERMGGQVQETKGIENMVSVVYTEGPQLAHQLYRHLASYPIKILEQRRVRSLTPDKRIHLEGGEIISGDSIIITTGAKWRELNVPGEKEYIGRGVAYCPHCDGPFYKDKKIAVVGGGNSGVEAAIDLAGIAAEVVVVEYNASLKADKILVDKLKGLKNVSVITHAKTTQLLGDGQKITAIQYMNQATQQLEMMPVDGVFVQIGLLPNSHFARETLQLTQFGEIVVDSKGHTSVPGIYAAGDVTTVPYKQIIIAMGEGAKVALAAFEDRIYSAASGA